MGQRRIQMANDVGEMCAFLLMILLDLSQSHHFYPDTKTYGQR